MASPEAPKRTLVSRLPFFSGKPSQKPKNSTERDSSDEDFGSAARPPKWSYGVLNDKTTIEVPGK